MDLKYCETVLIKGHLQPSGWSSSATSHAVLPYRQEGDVMRSRTGSFTPIMTALLGTVLATAMGLPAALAAETVEGPLHLVSGTLLKLDLATGRGLLRTDLGRPIYFDVPKAYLFENVIVGARIALRLDEEGRAVKVMDTSIPDLVAEPDQSVAATANDAVDHR
jgi:hypothetical protein